MAQQVVVSEGDDALSANESLSLSSDQASYAGVSSVSDASALSGDDDRSPPALPTTDGSEMVVPGPMSTLTDLLLHAESSDDRNAFEMMTDRLRRAELEAVDAPVEVKAETVDVENRSVSSLDLSISNPSIGVTGSPHPLDSVRCEEIGPYYQGVQDISVCSSSSNSGGPDDCSSSSSSIPMVSPRSVRFSVNHQSLSSDSDSWSLASSSDTSTVINEQYQKIEVAPLPHVIQVDEWRSQREVPTSDQIPVAKHWLEGEVISPVECHPRGLVNQRWVDYLYERDNQVIDELSADEDELDRPEKLAELKSLLGYRQIGIPTQPCRASRPHRTSLKEITVEEEMFVSFEEIAGVILHHFPVRCAPFLDVGCGTSRVCLDLVMRGYSHVRGVDTSASKIRFQSDRAAPVGNFVEFACANLTCLPFPAASFDCVFTKAVLDTIAANRESKDGTTLLMEVLVELTRCLKPGGLWISVTCQVSLVNAPVLDGHQAGNDKCWWQDRDVSWFINSQFTFVKEYGAGVPWKAQQHDGTSAIRQRPFLIRVLRRKESHAERFRRLWDEQGDRICGAVEYIAFIKVRAVRREQSLDEEHEERELKLMVLEDQRAWCYVRNYQFTREQRERDQVRDRVYERMRLDEVTEMTREDIVAGALRHQDEARRDFQKFIQMTLMEIVSRALTEVDTKKTTTEQLGSAANTTLNHPKSKLPQASMGVDENAVPPQQERIKTTKNPEAPPSEPEAVVDHLGSVPAKLDLAAASMATPSDVETAVQALIYHLITQLHSAEPDIPTIADALELGATQEITRNISAAIGDSDSMIETVEVTATEPEHDQVLVDKADAECVVGTGERLQANPSAIGNDGDGDIKNSSVIGADVQGDVGREIEEPTVDEATELVVSVPDQQRDDVNNDHEETSTPSNRILEQDRICNQPGAEPLPQAEGSKSIEHLARIPSQLSELPRIMPDNNTQPPGLIDDGDAEAHTRIRANAADDTIGITQACVAVLGEIVNQIALGTV